MKQVGSSRKPKRALLSEDEEAAVAMNDSMGSSSSGSGNGSSSSGSGSMLFGSNNGLGLDGKNLHTQPQPHSNQEMFDDGTEGTEGIHKVVLKIADDVESQI